ncbi:MAG TPA: cytochrome C [Burkholderiaceae bacterium]|nr:cytochrome C [Burkholderiaceae bacterium]
MTFVRKALAAVLIGGAVSAAAAAEVDRSLVQIGESIYLHGVLGSGAELQAMREGGGPGAKGGDAACVNCHLRSALGSSHQSTGIGARTPARQIPPIAGRYLFESAMIGHDQPNLPYVDGMRTNRSPYTEATLARVLREGIDPDGHRLGYLMPRFSLGDDDLAALIAYLKTIDPTRVPGVTDTDLHFATIVTPDVDPARRDAMVHVMQAYFDERNIRQMNPSAQMRASGRTQYARSMFMVHRQWRLHVWDLKGQPSEWSAQLAEFFRKTPVFAVVSGLGASNWAPVHAFCEKRRLPCLFPNVEVPVDASGDYFELYLSRGVLLEVDLIAEGIRRGAGPGVPAARRVHQIYRPGDSGEPAARALAARLRTQGIEVGESVVSEGGRDLPAAVRAASGADALVLWLRPADLGALGDPKDAPATLYVSGLMAGLDHAPLPAPWRGRAHMAYPVDLPEQRVVRVDYPMGWFRIRKIPVVDERLQADTYLACGLLSEALKDMTGTFFGPYLIEEMQTMVEHRTVTGYYPRLSLAENQHFASKGGYLVHFGGPEGTRIVADSDWIVP